MNPAICQRLKDLPASSCASFRLNYHCAPTLDGIKPANLVCMPNSAISDACVDDLKRMYPVDVLLLKETSRCKHFLIYRKNTLFQILTRKKESSYLSSLGYPKEPLEMLEYLKSRYQTGCPSEIGIILGYPLADVIAYTMAPNDPGLLVGYWKVYSNPHLAKKTFEQYKKSQDACIQRFFKQ